MPEVKLEVVDTILEKIKKAKAPLILVGTGIRLGGAEELLLKLLDKLQIPVVLLGMQMMYWQQIVHTLQECREQLAPDQEILQFKIVICF